MSTEAQLSSATDASEQFQTVKRIIERFDREEMPRIKERWRLFFNEETTAQMRAQQLIAADEVYISEGLVANNVSAQIPALLAYIIRNPRIIYFNHFDNAAITYAAESLEFSRHARYPGYEVPWIRFLHGRLLHGGAAMEIVYDPSMPLHFRLESIGREELILPMHTRNINDCEFVIIRRPQVYISQLRTMQFKPEILDRLTRGKKSDDTICLYRVLCLKPDGLYYSWAAMEDGINEFLMDFTPYTLGLIDPNTLKPQRVMFYPIVISPYEFIENPEYYESRGIAAKSRHDQEAIARLKTAVVNGATKAARINACVDPQPGEEAAAETTLVANSVVNRRLRYHNNPWPDAVFLHVIDTLRVANKQGVGQIDFAALSRRDSRKTATEVHQAAAVQEGLSAVATIGISIAVRECYSIAWQITRAAILAGRLENAVLTPQFALGNYRIGAAGDIDLVERTAKIDRIMQFLPLAANTPLLKELLGELILLMFPDDASRWLPILADNKTALLAALNNIIKNLPPAFIQSLPPDVQQAIQTITQQVDEEIGANGPANNLAEPAGDAGIPPDITPPN